MRGGLLLIIIFNLCAHSSCRAECKGCGAGRLERQAQSRVEVYYFCQSETHNFLPADSDITNSDGIAIVSYPCKDDQKIAFDVTALPKEECGELHAVTFKEISEIGIVSPPDGERGMHCPTKISRKLKPVPGQVIIFIKKASWWQYRF